MDIRTKVKRFIKVRKTGSHRDEKGRFYVASRDFPSEEQAKKEFLDCKYRLLHVDIWTCIAELGRAAFSIYSHDGKPLTGVYPVKGEFIRIDFPELFPVFWICIEMVTEDTDVAEVIALPVNDPTGKENRSAAFANPYAHCIFRVEREDKALFAVIMNTLDPDRQVDTGRSKKDWKLFLDRPWKSLAEYLVGMSSS